VRPAPPGAAWLWLVLDRRRRMGEEVPQGCSRATASGRAAFSQSAHRDADVNDAVARLPA